MNPSSLSRVFAVAGRFQTGCWVRDRAAYCYHILHVSYLGVAAAAVVLRLALVSSAPCYDVVRFAATGNRQSTVPVVHDSMRRRTAVVGTRE